MKPATRLALTRSRSSLRRIPGRRECEHWSRTKRLETKHGPSDVSTARVPCGTICSLSSTNRQIEMQRVFLAFSFRNQDQDLVRRIEALLESHDIQVETGEALGGQALTQAVQKRIDESDALVAVLTRSERLASGKWSTHDWVRDELNYARTKRKRAIALVDVAVDVGGTYQEHERIDLDTKKESLSLLKLSQAVSEWKREWGRRVKIRILPEDLGHTVRSVGDRAKCHYRLTRQGTQSKWLLASLVPEPGGTYAYIRGATEEDLIQLRVSLPGESWISPAVPQWMDATLAKAVRR
jgi:hypothetical protein